MKWADVGNRFGGQTVVALLAAGMAWSAPLLAQAETIRLPPGVTRIERPIEIGPDRSGMVIEGAADGSSVLSGAKEYRLDFKPAGNGVVAAAWHPDHVPDQIFVNGRKYVMARYPNRRPGDGRNVYDVWRLGEGAAGEEDALADARVKTWKDPSGGYLHAMHAALWGDMHWRIRDARPDGSLDLEGGWQNNRPTPPHPVYRYVENVREELDAPGEWFYDNKEGRLLLVPLEGEKLADACVESVVLRSLVLVRGTTNAPVCGVRIRNVAFRQAARMFMENRERLLRSDWTLCREAAVVLSGAKDCRIEDCRFADLGGNALLLDGFASGCEVVRSRFEEIGASGVVVCGRTSAVRVPMFDYHDRRELSDLDRTPGPRTEEYPRDCGVEDCSFRRTGREEKQTAAVTIDIASRIRVRNCKIRETPRAGINIGDGCFGGHLVEGCDVAETVLETGDHGAFNSWGRDRWWTPSLEAMDDLMERAPDVLTADCRERTVLRGNTFRCDHGWDIDLDDGSSFYTIESNLCLRGGIKLREGFGRIVRGNRCVDNGLHPHCWLRTGGDVIGENHFERDPQPAGRITYINLSGLAGASKAEIRLLDGMRWRRVDGKIEYSAFGVLPTFKGWVLVAGAQAPWRDGDLIEGELPSKLTLPTTVIRNQAKVKLE